MAYIMSALAVALGCYYFYSIQKHSGRIVQLIYFELIYNLMIKFLIGNIGLLSSLNYLSDVICVWIVIEHIYQKRRRRIKAPRSLTICVAALFLVSVASFVFNMYSPLLYLWGFRNNFRFLIFAVMCAVHLDKADIKTIMQILQGFFILNIFIVTYQAFFTTYSERAVGDFISGLYSNGRERGGNAALNWMMCIVCTYAIVEYLRKKKTLLNLALYLFGSVYMAAMAEIKLFFLQIVIISVVAVAISKKSLKVIGFSALGAISIVLGIQMLYYFFPEFAAFFQIEQILSYVTRETGYGSAGHRAGIDRLTALPFILSHYLVTPLQRILGFGLGNADYSSNFSFLTSRFYAENSWSNYVFFSFSFMLIEQGFAGVAMYVMIFVNSFREALTCKNESAEGESIKTLVMLTSIIAITMFFSNASLRTESSGYLVHCINIFPFLLKKDSKDEELERTKIDRLRVKISW